MKRILILIKPTQQYVWVNYPDFMSEEDRNNAIDELYGPGWKCILVTHSVTLIYNV